MEEAPVSDFRSEETLRHPYTKALWRALPQNGFTPLDGTQPYVKDMPQGCPFEPRCSWYQEECTGRYLWWRMDAEVSGVSGIVCKTEIPPIGDITI